MAILKVESLEHTWGKWIHDFPLWVTCTSHIFVIVFHSRQNDEKCLFAWLWLATAPSTPDKTHKTDILPTTEKKKCIPRVFFRKKGIPFFTLTSVRFKNTWRKIVHKVNLSCFPQGKEEKSLAFMFEALKRSRHTKVSTLTPMLLGFHKDGNNIKTFGNVSVDTKNL